MKKYCLAALGAVMLYGGFHLTTHDHGFTGFFVILSGALICAIAIVIGDDL